MTRHECRAIAMKMIFSSLDNQKYDAQAHLNEIMLEQTIADNEMQFIMNLFDAATVNREEIISRLAANLIGYEWRRVYKVDKSLLILALAEIAFIAETPVKVVVNEIVELAKEYSTDKSPRFINGVLANFVEKV